MDERTFVCPACRLLQAPGTECAECGGPTADVDAASELLRYRDPADVMKRSPMLKATIAGLGAAIASGIAGLVFLGPLGLAALPVIAYGSMVGAGAITTLRARRYGKVVAIHVADPKLDDGAITRTGIARPLTGPMTSKLDGAPILAEQVVIRDGSSILLRRVYATPFVISNDPDPDGVVMLGEIRLATPVVTTKLRTTDPRFAQIGIPAGFLPKKVTVDIRTIRPGTIVSARGVVEDATLQELAVLREGGQAVAMHGRRGSLVVVSVP